MGNFPLLKPFWCSRNKSLTDIKRDKCDHQRPHRARSDNHECEIQDRYANHQNPTAHDVQTNERARELTLVSFRIVTVEILVLDKVVVSSVLDNSSVKKVENGRVLHIMIDWNTVNSA